jgi:hypothetical protein
MDKRFILILYIFVGMFIFFPHISSASVSLSQVSQCAAPNKEAIPVNINGQKLEILSVKITEDIVVSGKYIGFKYETTVPKGEYSLSVRQVLKKGFKVPQAKSRYVFDSFENKYGDELKLDVLLIPNQNNFSSLIIRTMHTGLSFNEVEVNDAQFSYNFCKV